MFFWTHQERDGYCLDEPDPDVDFAERLELDTPVILVDDPHQVVQPLGNVLNGSKIKVVEVFPPNIIIGRTEAVEYQYTNSLDPLTPPGVAEKILFLMLSRSERQTIIGDLAEEWQDIKTRHGSGFANAWYWEQTILSLWPLFKRAARWSALAGFGEWIRRLIS